MQTFKILWIFVDLFSFSCYAYLLLLLLLLLLRLWTSIQVFRDTGGIRGSLMPLFVDTVFYTCSWISMDSVGETG